MPMNMSEANAPDTLYLFALSGIGTAPGFMKEFHEQLCLRLAGGTGAAVAGGLLFPYGDWSRQVHAQIWEVWRDIRLPCGAWQRSRGLAAVRGELEEAACGKGPVVLVGHSGGGVAAIHAASMLLAASPGRPVAVVEIGSPRSPVPPALQEAALYGYAARPNGGGRDPVCRLGSWRDAGRQRQFSAGVGAAGPRRTGLLSFGGEWRPPGTVLPLPIVGRHPDYFRSAMRNARGESNLELTLGAVEEHIRRIWPWLFGDGGRG